MGSGDVVAQSSFNRSPFAGVAAPEVTQETVESLMQKFKESFRTNTPIEIGQLQPALRSTSVGRRKRRSRPRGRLSQSPAAPPVPWVWPRPEEFGWGRRQELLVLTAERGDPRAPPSWGEEGQTPRSILWMA